MHLPVDKTRKIVLASILCTIAMALSIIDVSISTFLILLPGFKIGLANIISLFVLYKIGLLYALMICVTRSLITALLSGQIMGLFYSLAGGLTSIVVMYLLMHLLGIIKVSVTGGVVHNIMQVTIAILFTDTPQIVFYLPILIIAGAIGGFLMGVLCKCIFQKIKFDSFPVSNHLQTKKELEYYKYSKHERTVL